jgi:serine/threonine-protein kinase
VEDTLAGPQLERVQALAQTLLGAAMQTIRPESRARATTTRDRASEVVGQLEELAPSRGKVELKETLGQGGMGIVRLGTQNSIVREVAVKTAREDRRSERTTLKLLREAWVNGALEHPNILPVYDLGMDEGRAPVIVMRLVDGADWQNAMHDPESIKERFGDEDPLEWNLRVLMQVCNALSYAHDRKIVHRDLKPSNVMLGRFGEVYLVDWGIAVSLVEDEQGRFPVREPEGEVVGTPAYMAPEMLRGDMQALGAATDVYLLGAVLHEIIVGEAPHASTSIASFVDSVMQSRPEFPKGAPAELAAICRRAMSARVEDRYASAQDLRLALQGFLRHRTSMRLSGDGQIVLTKLLARSEKAREEEAGPDESAEADRLFAEVRFAFDAALKEWPQNTEACEGRREALLCMAELHIVQEEARPAARLLAEIGDPPQELVAALESLRDELARRGEEHLRLERLGRDNDASFGQRTRWFVLLVLGLLWSIVPPALASTNPIPASFLEVAIFPAFFLVGLAAFAWWARESLMGTAFNRKVTGMLVAVLVAQLILTAGASAAKWPIPMLLPMEFFMWFVVATMFCIAVDRRFWPPAVGYLVGFLVVAAAQPEIVEIGEFVSFALNCMGLTHFVLTLTCLVIWRPRTFFKRLPDEHLRGSGREKAGTID